MIKNMVRMMKEYNFDHEKLKVYQKALSFLVWFEQVLSDVEKKYSVYNQLERASTSIALNIAEGNGKFSSKDRCKYFDISRGSSLECAGGIDILVIKGLLSAERGNEGKIMLSEIVSMLVGLIKSNSDRVYESSISYNFNNS